MSVQANPTIASLTLEAWKKSGVAPSASDLIRAKDEFLQEIFNDIWIRTVKSGDTRLKTLQATVYFNSVAGQNFIDLAEDMDEEYSVTIMDGTVRGTAQSGASGSITLAADDAMTATRALGKTIFITGGTGAGQTRRITLLNTTSKAATVTPVWTTPPDSSSTYLIVERTQKLDEENQADADEWMPQQAGRPSFYSKYGRQIVFDKAFDLATYGVQLRHYQNLMQIDMTEGTGTLLTRILRNWQSVLKQGITWKVLESQNDSQQPVSMQKYEQLVGALIAREIPYGGEFSGFVL